MKPPSSILSAVRTLTASKDALKKLSKAAIDFDVRPHELIDAIVVYTNWEVQVGKLAARCGKWHKMYLQYPCQSVEWAQPDLNR